jgi:hypothetical protein
MLLSDGSDEEGADGDGNSDDGDGDGTLGDDDLDGLLDGGDRLLDELRNGTFALASLLRAPSPVTSTAVT